MRRKMPENTGMMCITILVIVNAGFNFDVTPVSTHFHFWTYSRYVNSM
jgi:hypothetical protein